MAKNTARRAHGNETTHMPHAIAAMHHLGLSSGRLSLVLEEELDTLDGRSNGLGDTSGGTTDQERLERVEELVRLALPRREDALLLHVCTLFQTAKRVTKIVRPEIAQRGTAGGMFVLQSTRQKNRTPRALSLM